MEIGLQVPHEVEWVLLYHVLYGFEIVVHQHLFCGYELLIVCVVIVLQF